MEVLATLLSLLCVSTAPVESLPELKLLQIVFAHKTFAPILDLIKSNETDLPRTLTYRHFVTAPLDMPNRNKLNMHKLGSYLRETYNEFLGEIYTHETMKMQTAGYSLSMISGQLVNSGLWPPAERQKWNEDVNWQPIPTEYFPMEIDSLLLGTHCPSFQLEMERVLRMETVRERLSHYAALFERVSSSIGMKIQRPSEVALLYAVLETKADLNQSLPHWAQDIFPDGGMYDVSLLEYDLLWETPLQKQLNGGTILKEVLTNSLMYIKGSIPGERKLMAYSGNERNIVSVLKALNLWSPHIPNEGASVIFELYFDDETGDHGMKINYYTGVDGLTIPLKIPNCTEICPIKSFLHLVFDVLPQNAQRLCNWEKITSNYYTIYSRSTSNTFERITLALLLAVTLYVN
ncbi:Venom acid phosphatase Acph-1 [Anthophora retusa]